MIKHSKLGFCKPITTTVQWQIDLKQNPNPKVGGGYWLYSLRDVKDPSSRRKGVPTRYKAQRPKRRCRSTLTDSGRWLVSTISIDSKEILMWNHFDWLPYQIIFPSICGSSKTEFGCVLGIHFIADWSWWPRQTRTRIGLGLWLGLDVLAGLLRWWPRRRTSKAIS
jgi:hypothetical protein